MFSPLTPAEVVTAIGRATREAARGAEPASDFARGQLMSAFSISRHLQVELATFEPELQAFAGAAAAALRDASGTQAEGRLARHAADVEEAAGAHAVGNAVCAALDDLRVDSGPAATALRERLHVLLRGLADREVGLLADVIEAPRKA